MASAILVTWNSSKKINTVFFFNFFCRAGLSKTLLTYFGFLKNAIHHDFNHKFIENVKKAPKMDFKNFEDTPFFEGCMPIEEIIRRGDETLRFGPMKPVGLTNPNKSEEPYAIVQLRQDNKSGTLYNIVGFQTKNET